MKNKKIRFFAVVKASDPTTFISIVNTKQEATEYISLRVRQDKLSHFVPWCRLHDQDPKTLASWNIYVQTCLVDEDIHAYKILPVTYDLKHIACIFRMFAKCLPLGASFDSSVEYEQFVKDYLTHTITDSAVEELNKNLEVNDFQIDFKLLDRISEISVDLEKEKGVNNG